MGHFPDVVIEWESLVQEEAQPPDDVGSSDSVCTTVGAL
jgi:hypothetical protein